MYVIIWNSRYTCTFIKRNHRCCFFIDLDQTGTLLNHHDVCVFLTTYVGSLYITMKRKYTTSTIKCNSSSEPKECQTFERMPLEFRPLFSIPRLTKHDAWAICLNFDFRIFPVSCYSTERTFKIKCSPLISRLWRSRYEPEMFIQMWIIVVNLNTKGEKRHLQCNCIPIANCSLRFWL